MFKRETINQLREHIGFEGLLCALCVIVLGLGVVLIYTGGLPNLSDQIRYFGFAFSTLSILYAAKQFRANHDWNRRQLAIVTVREIKNDLNKHVVILDKAFRYVHRTESNPITVDEIHKKICKSDKDSGELIFVPGTKDKLEINHDNDATGIRRAILHVLNGYEYLATGVYQGVFDQRIIEKLYRGPIIKHYDVFKTYVSHYNKEMHPDRGGTVWEHFVRFAEEMKGERNVEKRKGADQ